MKAVYAVIPHCVEGTPTGRGWVVRHQDDVNTRDYKGAKHFIDAWYVRRGTAQKRADALTFDGAVSTAAPACLTGVGNE